MTARRLTGAIGRPVAETGAMANRKRHTMSFFRPANALMVQYAQYHRDRRNIATHFVGIPMIVLAVVVLLARPSLQLVGWPVSAATLAVIAATLYYLRLDRRLGAFMGALLLGCLWLAQLGQVQSPLGRR